MHMVCQTEVKLCFVITDIITQTHPTKSEGIIPSWIDPLIVRGSFANILALYSILLT